MYPLGAIWDQQVDLQRLRADRVARIHDWLDRSEIDAIISCRPENVGYLTALRPMWGEYLGYLTRYAGVLGKDSDPILLVRPEELGRCKTGMTWIPVDNIRPLYAEDAGRSHEAIVRSLTSIIHELGASRGRVAIDAVEFGVLKLLEKSLPDVELVDGDFFMKEAKMLKTPDEIALLRMACAITDVGYRVAQKSLVPGRRECEVLGDIYRAQYEIGAERPQGTHIVASGWRTVPIHRMATDKIIEDGDLVFLDLGICFNNYFSDGTRVYVAGSRKPTEEQRRLHKAIHASLQAMIELCRPGTRNSQLNKAGRKVIEDNGYGEYSFFGLFGHGLGTSAQEAPVIGEAAHRGELDATLAPGMVIALEPGAFVPGVGGVRCEDVVLITDGEPEVLTRAPYDERLM